MAHRGVNISPILTDNASVIDKGLMGPLNQLPSLKTTSEVERANNVKFNEYRDENTQRYNSTHPNAQSDGDDHGRGERQNNGGVGNSIDMARKNALIYGSAFGLSNKFTPKNGYCGINKGEEYW